MSLPSTEAMLTLTEPLRTPSSPVPGSSLEKIVAPLRALRVRMYEPRCSSTGAGRSRNRKWLRSKDSLSGLPSVGRVSLETDMRLTHPNSHHCAQAKRRTQGRQKRARDAEAV